MSDHPRTYPVRVEGAAQPSASRALWLVKWLLLIPHYLLLALLWPAFVLVSVIAFFAILLTGRYPRALFDFNVGVLRWSWRVSYYGYGALGTDRYPPFSLAEVAEFPAHLDVAYPARLSRGLVLVKWWLLAIPHYLIVALFVGGGIWVGTWWDDTDGFWDTSWGAGGLVALLVLVCGVVLLFTGRHPQPLYDFILGMDRWSLRVAAYAALMTDEYPPFRLDMGGPEPGAPTSPPASPPTAPWPAADRDRRPAPWTVGRVATLVIGALLTFGAAGAFVGGGTLVWANQQLREGDYLMSPEAAVTTEQYAVVSESVHLEGGGLDWVVDEVVGDVRLEVTASDPNVDVFVGVAPSADVARYLQDVGYAEIDDIDRARDGRSARVVLTEHPAGAPTVLPTDSDIWIAATSGSGTQSLTWRASEGDWTLLVMPADGTAGMSAELRIGASVPGLPWVIAGIFAAGAALLALGGALIAVAATWDRTGGINRSERPAPAAARWSS